MEAIAWFGPKAKPGRRKNENACPKKSMERPPRLGSAMAKSHKIPCNNHEKDDCYVNNRDV